MVFCMEIEMKCSLLTVDFFSMLHSQHYFVAVSIFLCFTVILQCIIVFFSIHNIFHPGSSYVYASTFCRVPANQNQ